MYASSGAISLPADPATKSRHLGQEIDLVAEYDVNRALDAGFGYARFFTGQYVRTATQGKDFNYPFVYLTYSFGP